MSFDPPALVTELIGSAGPRFVQWPIMELLLTLALGLMVTAPLAPAGQGAAEKASPITSEILITTLPTAEVTASKTLEHDTEVARNEAVTVVVMLPACQKDPQGACNAAADIVAYTPDGKVHSEMKGVSLKEGRGMSSLKLAPTDPTGVYKVVATIRDLNARRFGKAERLFGVK